MTLLRIFCCLMWNDSMPSMRVLFSLENEDFLAEQRPFVVKFFPYIDVCREFQLLRAILSQWLFVSLSIPTRPERTLQTQRAKSRIVILKPKTSATKITMNIN